MALLWVSFSLACTEEVPQSVALLSQIKQQYGVSIEKIPDSDQLPKSIVSKIQNKEVLVQFTPPTTAQFYRYLGIVNPADFNYINNPAAINTHMNTVKSYNACETQLKQGLVSSCGKANAEKDINSYAELIFTKPETLNGYIWKYPWICNKYEMVKRFYLSVSPEFSGVFSLVK